MGRKPERSPRHDTSGTHTELVVDSPQNLNENEGEMDRPIENASRESSQVIGKNEPT